MVATPAELEAGVLEARAQDRPARDQPRGMTMEFVLTVHVDDESTRHAAVAAQIPREVTATIEMQIPLAPGIYKERLTGSPKPAWQTWNYEPLPNIPIINTHAPDPGPV